MNRNLLLPVQSYGFAVFDTDHNHATNASAATIVANMQKWAH